MPLDTYIMLVELLSKMLGDGWTGWYPLNCMTTKALAVLVMKNRECHWANQYHDHECVWVCVFGLKNDSTLDIISKWIVLLPDIFSYSCIHSWKALTPYWSPIYIFSWTKWFVRFFAHQVLTDWVWEGGGGILSNLPRANTGQASTSEWLDQTTGKSGLCRWWTIIKKRIFKWFR